MKHQQTFSIKGMTRDISLSKSSSEYAYEIKNMRITAQEGETTLSLVNEKGNKVYTIHLQQGDITFLNLMGTVIGYCIIDKYLTLFTHTELKDAICKLQLSTIYDDTLEGTVLYVGDLGFTDDMRLETLGIYESEAIQKVYWVDGVHQPRFINIAADDDTIDLWKRQSTPFDFIPKYSDSAEISIEKSSYSGTFPAATVQYAMCYYNLNGQQTNIIYQSPLFYTSHSSRGAAADESVSNSFTISIKNADPNFDYIRVFQIMRTSVNDTAVCKIVVDIPITSSKYYTSDTNAAYKAEDINFTDTGNYGTSVDAYEVMYTGGRLIIPQTMTQKDNTLFFGNYHVEKGLVPTAIQNNLQNENYFSFIYGDSISKGATGAVYMYDNQLKHNSEVITTFKGGENYRFGLVFQDDRGEWSNVVYLCDKHNSKYPDDNITSFKPVKGQFTIPESVVKELITSGYRAAKGVVVYPSDGDKEVVCQGVLCPTVYTIEDRRNNAPYAASSWFFRDYHAYDSLNTGHADYNVQNRHNYNISTLHSQSYSSSSSTTDKVISGACYYDSEILGASREDVCVMAEGSEGNPMDVFIDYNVLTLNTPEIAFEDVVLPTTGLKMRIVGAIPLTGGSCDININTSTAPKDTSITNFKRNIFSSKNLSSAGNRIRLSDIDWYDKPYTDNSIFKNTNIRTSETYWQYPVFPWQRKTSLIAQIKESDTSSMISEVNTKVLANIRVSAVTLFTSDTENNTSTFSISNAGVYDGETALVRLDADSNNPDYLGEEFNYYGQQDTTLMNTTGYHTFAYDGSGLYQSNTLCQDSVRVKYKSTPHLAFQLKYTSNNKQTILPSLTIGDTTLGTMTNPGGTLPHWSKRYNSTSSEGSDPDNSGVTGKPLVAHILTDSEGNTIDIEWVKNHQSLLGIDGVTTINNTLLLNAVFSLEGGYVDVAFLKKYVPGGYVSEGDVILFPNVTYMTSKYGSDSKPWVNTPIPYVINSTISVSQSDSGEIYLLLPLYNTSAYIYATSHGNTSFTTWYYKDKTANITYTYNVSKTYTDDLGNKYTCARPGAILISKTSSSTDDDGGDVNLSSAKSITTVIDKYTDGSTIDDDWISNHSDLVVINDTGMTNGGYMTVFNLGKNFVSREFIAKYISYPSIGDTICFKNSKGLSDAVGNILWEIAKITDDKCTILPYGKRTSKSGTGDFTYYNPYMEGAVGWWKYDTGKESWDLYYVADDVQGIEYRYSVSKSSSGSTGTDGGYLSQGNFNLNSNTLASSFMQSGKEYGFLYIGELYRASIDRDAIFGGKTATALQNNTWNTAGEVVKLSQGQSCVVPFNQGDTYYQRFDCLKTYPYTNDDPNQIIEVLSFMCETRINIDGRYDKQRGLSSNLTVRPTNFNLLNTVYTQNNNFITSSYLDSKRFKEQNYPNSILWSKTKTYGEDVDSWATLQQTSTLDLDGDKGVVQALVNYNGSLLSFQDSGIARILYNERVQINASDGVPIEIANSGKVQGKEYLSDIIGCSNKRTIKVTPNGVYFMDSQSKDLYLMADGIQSLSKMKGFNNWFYKKDFSEFRTFYDKKNKDVYFVDKTHCLAFNETLGEFTGFYSYEATDFMFNLEDHFVAVKDNSLWHQYAGEYNYFFGDDDILNYKPFAVTYISNENQDDKIFTNVDFLADSWDGDTLQYTTLDTLSVWNEYQFSVADLRTQNLNTSKLFSSLKRKFRIWRAQIPRALYIDGLISIEGTEKIVDSLEANGGKINEIDFDYSIKKSMDRIRNTWAYVRLSMQNANKNKTVLHTVSVDYFN